MPTRWRLVVEYDGAGFFGWQYQPDLRTVQSALATAVGELFQEQPTLTASGRTDAGVHAEGQVVSFMVHTERSAHGVRSGLNALLPVDIAVVQAEIVPLEFDPRRWALSKCYRYTWLDRPGRSPLRRHRSWFVPPLRDVPAMHRAAQTLVGRHDFSSFRATGCTAAHPIRIIEEIAVVRAGDEVHLWVHGVGFLRHMVRNIAGTLTDIGQGRRPESWVAEVLEARDRHAAGRTAPAHGLTLAEVRYGDKPPPWHSDGEPGREG